MIEEVDIRTIRNLVSSVKEQYSYDYSDYALSSFKRRIIAFTNKNGLSSLDQFLTRLKNDRLFFQNFQNFVPVPATEMYRGPSFWRYLRDDIFPEFEKLPKLKIWVAGCGSGEELYSLLILLHEAGLSASSSITATDLTDSMLRNARKGIVNADEKDLNARNYARLETSFDLNKYFTTVDGAMTLNKTLLLNVNFQTFDHTSNFAPFDEFDFVLCRNVLIYFNHTLHERVLGLINNSLRKRGILALGVKESLIGSAAHNSFRAINEEEKVFRKY